MSKGIIKGHLNEIGFQCVNQINPAQKRDKGVTISKTGGKFQVL
jgi:hypothetical protein